MIRKLEKKLEQSLICLRLGICFDLSWDDAAKFSHRRYAYIS